jgi:hypothetical protein
VLTPSGWKSTFQLRARGGSGGNGGDWGSSAGLAGTASDVAAETFTLSTRGSAGGAGKYIDGSAYATWTNAGTRLGTTS